MHASPPKGRKPWYLRPLPIIALACTLLIGLATVPPLLAGPTPVALNEEGERAADEDDWQRAELGMEARTELLGGQVQMEADALQKNDEDGYPVAGYTWASLKIPAMLPRDLVEERLREFAIDTIDQILQDVSRDLDPGAGILLDPTPTQDTTSTINGHDTHLTRYEAKAHLSDQDLEGIPDAITFTDDVTMNGEAFIATWRCSVLGSYAIAFGVARDQFDLKEFQDLHKNGDLDNGELDVDGLLEEHGNGDATSDLDNLDPIDHLPLEMSAGSMIDQMQTRLLANTVCGE